VESIGYLLEPIGYLVEHIGYLVENIGYLVEHIGFLVGHIGYLVGAIGYLVEPLCRPDGIHGLHMQRVRFMMDPLGNFRWNPYSAVWNPE
jgi:hypothetical protein